MNIAMVLFRYFPFGGLQRDFARISAEAIARGHKVTAIVSEWQGESVPDMECRLVSIAGRSNHVRMRYFAREVKRVVDAGSYDCVVGFNRLPGLDIYFASDGCFRAHMESKPVLASWLPRYRTYLSIEEEVFGPNGPVILFLNEQQKEQYLAHYALPVTRYRIVPPGIDQSRRRTDDYLSIRQAKRNELGVKADNTLILFLGSGFKVKGLDRALKAFARLQESARLMIVGSDDARQYLLQVPESVRSRIMVLGPRSDVSALMQAADLLLHPAYRESAGMVLLEATVAGLPVLTTDTCGYAQYIKEAGSGVVVSSPFRQESLNDLLAKMVAGLPGEWSERGVAYGKNPALYQLPEYVMDEIERCKG